ncbi:MAG: hypothetical protein DRP87_17745 [Spirochaetes bacterium]|nr:MAG: hypothetical protein DRP87_17745 [Spirochaetota bacterium]
MISSPGGSPYVSPLFNISIALRLLSVKKLKLQLARALRIASGIESRSSNVDEYIHSAVLLISRE